MKRDIFLRYKYQQVVYVYLLIRYCLFYYYFIIYIWVNLGMLHYGIRAFRTLGDLRVMGLFLCALIGLLVKTT